MFLLKAIIQIKITLRNISPQADVYKRQTISGGEVNAIGGDWSAGIGGGHTGDGSDITISGGEVSALSLIHI